MDFREATQIWCVYANGLSTHPEINAHPPGLWDTHGLSCRQLWDRKFSVGSPESHFEPRIFPPTHLPVTISFGDIMCPSLLPGKYHTSVSLHQMTAKAVCERISWEQASSQCTGDLEGGTDAVCSQMLNMYLMKMKYTKWPHNWYM